MAAVPVFGFVGVVIGDVGVAVLDGVEVGGGTSVRMTSSLLSKVLSAIGVISRVADSWLAAMTMDRVIVLLVPLPEVVIAVEPLRV